MLIVFLASFLAFGNSEQLNELILKNKPTLGKVESAKIAEVLSTLGAKYNVNPYVFAGILMVESGYELSSVNTESKDYGIAQINKNNVRNMKLNKKLLLTDHYYSIESGILVFKYFLDKYKNYSVAVMRYNCGNRRSCTKTDKAKTYLRLVNKYSGGAVRSSKWF